MSGVEVIEEMWSVSVLRLTIESELALDFLPRLIVEHVENCCHTLGPTLSLTLSLTLLVSSLFVSFSKHSPNLNYNIGHCREERYSPAHPLQDVEGSFQRAIRGYTTNLMPNH